MKALRIATYWSAEEADCIYQLLDELKAAVWQSYGEEITKMHQAIWEEEQRKGRGGDDELNYELPF